MGPFTRKPSSVNRGSPCWLMCARRVTTLSTTTMRTRSDREPGESRFTSRKSSEAYPVEAAAMWWWWVNTIPLTGKKATAEWPPARTEPWKREQEPGSGRIWHGAKRHRGKPPGRQIVAPALTNVRVLRSRPDGISGKHPPPRLWGISRGLVPRARFQAIKKAAPGRYLSNQMERPSATNPGQAPAIGIMRVLLAKIGAVICW